MSDNYDCPFCGAYDSTHCEKLRPLDYGEHTEKQLEAARAVGCRVAYYTDKRLAASRGDRP